MYIDPAWRILTIGDGDLSFSYSLLKNYQPKGLTATIFDDYETLATKYGCEFFDQLKMKGCQVLTGFDVTQKHTWVNLKRQQFDVVIFQFPLIPAFNSAEDFKQQCKNISLNTLHRRLLRQYLINCFNEFLDTQGTQLAIITSKDVKPYRQWNIEQALTLNTDINYLGCMDFEIEKFPGYKIRNVDRDKHVKDTQGLCYVFSRLASTELDNKLTKSKYFNDGYCIFCRVGPFQTKLDESIHLVSKQHKQMAIFEQQWLSDIKNVNNTKNSFC